MFYCIYRIRNKINGKTYVGQHKYEDESNPMKGYKGSGKIGVYSDETRKKISEARAGTKASEETRKKMSEAHKGMAISEETKKKISIAKIGNKSTTGMHWYNNGTINKLSKECPEGFIPGRLK